MKKYIKLSRTLDYTDKEAYFYEKEFRKYMLKFIKSNYPKYLDKFKRIKINVSNIIPDGKSAGSFSVYPNDICMLNFYSYKIKFYTKVYSLEDYMEQVVLHEIIHAICYYMKEDFSDGQDFFENMLKKHNAFSSKASENPKGNTINIKKSLYKYECSCGKKYYKSTRTTSHCPKCDELYTFKGLYIKN